MALTDAEMVKMVRTGDVSAFAGLVHAHSDKVFAVAYSVLRDRGAAVEVSREAFVEAFNLIGALRDPDRFPGWICAVAAKMASRRMRKKKNEPPAAPAEKPAPAPAQGVVPTDPQREKALGMINQLPEMLRKIVLMRLVTGMSYRQIGAVLAVREISVAEKLFHARKLLDVADGHPSAGAR